MFFKDSGTASNWERDSREYERQTIHIFDARSPLKGVVRLAYRTTSKKRHFLCDLT